MGDYEHGAKRELAVIKWTVLNTLFRSGSIETMFVKPRGLFHIGSHMSIVFLSL